MPKTEFLKRLKKLMESHRERFGYPYLPLSLVREQLGLTAPELTKLLTQCLGEATITMTAVDEKVLSQLPAAIEVHRVADQSFVSVALAQ
ncbi:hypothetical protein [Candidatus Cyanaurora vandensis]|uniref:hypothetical protein n=1 Tax=Candidatus Cyanaurora vandensis TaxID=2714958 RepID=UPI00257E22A4|nr:hypothetical protein [Candidatus Cyanaurora vandensis]